MNETPQQPPLKIWMVTPHTWNVAAQAAQADSPDPADDASWKELVDAGIASQAGVLDPMWKAVLAQTLTAPIAFRVASTYNNLAYLADVSLGDNVTTCLTRRLSVAEAEDGSLEPTGADPQMEFVVTTHGRPWELIRRVLPPLDELRAEPRQTRTAERVEQAVDAETLKRIREGLDVPGLSPNMADALAPKASVTLMSLVDAPGAPEGSTGVGFATWVLGEDGLYTLERKGDTACVTKVSPGDIGFTITWLALGGFDIMERAAREATARTNGEG